MLDGGSMWDQYACMTLQVQASPESRVRLIRLDDAADLLAVSRRYLNELLARGVLRAVCHDPSSPKTARIRSDELDRYMSGMPLHNVGAA